MQGWQLGEKAPVSLWPMHTECGAAETVTQGLMIPLVALLMALGLFSPLLHTAFLSPISTY